jgi:hypothetical protein
MRLLEDNTIMLARTERGEFFAVYDPTERDPESRDRVTIKDMESADWVKFAFALKAEDGGSAKQRRVWLWAAGLIGEICERLKREGAEQAAEPGAKPVAEQAAGFWTGPGYRGECTCPHGVGHGDHIHGCCESGCCGRADFPLNPDLSVHLKARGKKGCFPKEPPNG